MLPCVLEQTVFVNPSILPALHQMTRLEMPSAQSSLVSKMLCLVGGSEASITPFAIAGFQALTALSTTEDPSRASIPFDKDRNGFVMGEGSGMLVLESLEHAEKRGATILAEVVGYGNTCDAYHMTSPHPEGQGAIKAIKLALEEAEISPEQVAMSMLTERQLLLMKKEKVVLS